jgi:hypothetical protein
MEHLRENVAGAGLQLPYEAIKEWSDWAERHSRYSREVAVETSGSERDTIGQPSPAKRQIESPFFRSLAVSVNRAVGTSEMENGALRPNEN